MINRGMEPAARDRGFDLLMSSVDVHEHSRRAAIAALAGKSDGLILHDRVLTPVGSTRLAGAGPVVTLAGTRDPKQRQRASDNEAGMRELTRHLVGRHGYREVAYLAGHMDSPDNVPAPRRSGRRPRPAARC